MTPVEGAMHLPILFSNAMEYEGIRCVPILGVSLGTTPVMKVELWAIIACYH